MKSNSLKDKGILIARPRVQATYLMSQIESRSGRALLVSRAMERLEPEGVLYFSNNHRKFALDDELATRFAVEEITQSTIDPDFQRSAGIHRCWAIRHTPPTVQ